MAHLEVSVIEEQEGVRLIERQIDDVVGSFGRLVGVNQDVVAVQISMHVANDRPQG